MPAPKFHPTHIFTDLDYIVLVPHAIAEEITVMLKAELASCCGLKVNPKKLKVWTPSGRPPPGGLRRHWAPEGLVLLGDPLDSWMGNPTKSWHRPESTYASQDLWGQSHAPTLRQDPFNANPGTNFTSTKTLT